MEKDPLSSPDVTLSLSNNRTPFGIGGIATTMAAGIAMSLVSQGIEAQTTLPAKDSVAKVAPDPLIGEIQGRFHQMSDNKVALRDEAKNALIAIARRNEHSARTLARLCIDALSNDSSEKRRIATEILDQCADVRGVKNMVELSADTLIDQLVEGTTESKKAAQQQLRHLLHLRTAALRIEAAAEDMSRPARAQAARLFAADCMPAIINAWEKPEQVERDIGSRAAENLLDFPNAHKAICTQLEGAMTHSDGEVRRRAIFALENFYSVMPTDYQVLPWIDMLPPDRDDRQIVIDRVLGASRSSWHWAQNADWPDYRYATYIYMVEQLKAGHSRKGARKLLDKMANEEEDYRGKRGMPSWRNRIIPEKIGEPKSGRAPFRFPQFFATDKKHATEQLARRTSELPKNTRHWTEKRVQQTQARMRTKMRQYA